MGQEEVREAELNSYSVREIVRRMWPLVKSRRWALVLASVLIAVCGMAGASVPLFGRYVIDEAIGGQKEVGAAVGVAAWAMGLFLVVQFTQSGLWYWSQTIIMQVQEEVIFKLRSMGFSHIQRLCLRFHGKYPSGFLHDRVFIQSISKIGGMITYFFSSLALQAASLCFALVVCLKLSVPLTGVIAAGAAGYVLIARKASKRIRKQAIECDNAHHWVCNFILDKLQGHKTIQAYALEERVDREFGEKVWQYQEHYLRARVEQQKLSLMVSTVGHLVTASIYVLGTYSIFEWKLSIGTLLAFVGYQGQLIGVISQLTMMYGQLAGSKTGFDQFFTVMDTQSSVEETVPDAEGVKLRGEVEFRKVTFAYEDDPVLFDATFRVPAGQSVALVGRSGAGKSTITNLLLRFYDPTEGDICMDGKRIQEYPLRGYRSRFGVVLQDPFLFDDTIENNLRCVRPNATEAEVRRALERAQALEFVDAMPEGMKRRVGERGSQLSGGQRQRVAIARAMLLNPDVLILDEATAALDNEAEAFVQRALEELFKDRTTFVIAHRLSTIRKVDRILVLDEGRLVEDGTYEGLLNKPEGLFRHLHDIATSSSLRKIKINEAGFA